MSRRKSSGDPWYSVPGKDQDVVLSTRVSLARNLANFPFSFCLKADDQDRIRSIVFDAFNRMDDNQRFQSLVTSSLTSTGRLVMTERDVLPLDSGEYSGAVLRDDGKVSCAVNIGDHLLINAFETGLNLSDCLKNSKNVDLSLQNYIQFAASYDFGYLTRNIMDAGSGMKMQFLVHLPCLNILNRIPAVMDELGKRKILGKEAFGSGGSNFVSGINSSASVLGDFYIVQNISSNSGTEFDQTANMLTAVSRIIEMEREAREECRKNHPSLVMNYLYRACALAKTSVFISLREGISIIGGLKLGYDCGIVKGIDDSELFSLLYRIRQGHLDFVIENGNFKFAEDLKSDAEKKTERFRALILQEAIQNILLEEL